MHVRAKFKVESIIPVTPGQEDYADGANINLVPVTSGSAENEQFYRYTPGGKITLATINQAAVQAFSAGQEFYVDFTPA